MQEISQREKKILEILARGVGRGSVQAVAAAASLDQSAVMRAVLSLKEKGMVEIAEKLLKKISLTEEGKRYAREGLPEKRMLSALASAGGGTVEDISRLAGLEKEIAGVGVAWLVRKKWAFFEGGLLKISDAGRAAVAEKSPEEVLLQKLVESPVDHAQLSRDEQQLVDHLVRRGLAETKDLIIREIEMTPAGKEALALGAEVSDVTELTREMIVSGKWRNLKFRKYVVSAPEPPVFPAKLHPQQRIIRELREILLAMGFVEIRARAVESEFWNFDVLFQAQDHPAREIHDSLSLSKPSHTKLPFPLARRVAAAHERGVAGSKGWGYKFNFGVSRRPVLCSQTTAATARYLAFHPEPPVKVFCIDRVYRHEKIDYKHLAEFYQCEGIVMEKDLTLSDMLGYLKEIAEKLGFKKIRFRPGYFPFTEPSVEADIYYEKRGEWIEVLGAGMFRPEMLEPMGIKYPVLAWGIGLTRLAMLKLGLSDIRDLFNNDLAWISQHAVGGGA
ncbi:MAG: phenylalanine--tRNA ligase subunit alpha [Candidatus Hadarchaeales archaeon]